MGAGRHPPSMSHALLPSHMLPDQDNRPPPSMALAGPLPTMILRSPNFEWRGIKVGLLVWCCGGMD